jgi:hypothetical protein
MPRSCRKVLRVQNGVALLPTPDAPDIGKSPCGERPGRRRGRSCVWRVSFRAWSRRRPRMRPSGRSHCRSARNASGLCRDRRSGPCTRPVAGRRSARRRPPSTSFPSGSLRRCNTGGRCRRSRASRRDTRSAPSCSAPPVCRRPRTLHSGTDGCWCRRSCSHTGDVGRTPCWRRPRRPRNRSDRPRGPRRKRRSAAHRSPDRRSDRRTRRTGHSPRR